MFIRWVRRSDRCFRNEGEGAARHRVPLSCRCGVLTTPSASSDRIPVMNYTSTWIRGLLAVALVAACPSLRAASFTWDGEGVSPTWGTAANWLTNTAPTFNNQADLLFPTSAVPNFNTALGANRVIRSLSFGADVDTAMSVSFQIQSGSGTAHSLTMDTDAVGGDASITVAAGAAGSINLGRPIGGTTGDLILADNLVVNHNGSGLLQFSENIAGTGSVTKNGSGIMQTDNNNNFTGALTVNAGRLIVGANSTNDFNASVTAINLGGGTLEVLIDSANNKNLTTAVNVTSPSILAYTNSTGTNQSLQFSGANAFALNAPLTIQNTSSNTTLVNGITISRNITGAGTMTVQTPNNIASSADNYSLGRVMLSGTNTGWNGNLVVAKGTVSLAGADVDAAPNGSIALGTTADAFGAGLTFFPSGPADSTVTYDNTILVRSGGFRSIKGSGTDHSILLSGNVVLEGNLNLDHSLANTGTAGVERALILSGNISGTGGLTVTQASGVGVSIARLTGTGSYTGGTRIDSGTLDLASTAQLTASGVTVDAGGTLVNSSAVLGAAITVESGGTLTGEGGSGPLSFLAGTTNFGFDPTTAGAFSAASVAADPAARVLLTAASGGTTGVASLVMTNVAGFSGGTVPSQFVPAERGNLSISGGGTQLTFTPTAALALLWSGTSVARPTAWNTADTANWSSGGLSERYYTGDQVTFDDSATTTTVSIDETSVSPGLVTFANAAKDYSLSGGTLVTAGGVTKTGAGSVTLAGGLEAGGDVVVSAGALALNGTANSFVGLTVTRGTLSLAAARNTFTTGSITVTGGELRFQGAASGAVASVLGQRPVTLGPGRITYSGTAVQTNDEQTFTMAAHGAVVSVDAPGTTTWRIGGKVTGPGNWTKSGTGTLGLGRNNDIGAGNDFTGRLSVTEGMLDIRQSDALGASGSTANGTEVVNAAILLQNFGQTTGSGIVVAESLTFAGTSSVLSYVQENKTFTNRLTGPLAVIGTLGIAATSGTAVSGTASMTFVVDGDVSTGQGSWLELGSVGPAAFTFASVRQPLVINGVISGGASLATTASGTYTLAAANTFSGSTRPQAGTLVLANTAALGGSTVNLRLGDTGTIAFMAGASSYLFGGLAGDRSLDAAGVELVVGGNGASTTYSGTIVNGQLVKTGTGTLRLASAGAISGTATVHAGVLEIATPSALTTATVATGSAGTLTAAAYQASTLGGLNLNAGGRVDVVNGFVTVATGLSTTQLVSELLQGRGDGSWNGTSGITSSVVRAEVGLGMQRAIGWLDNGDGSVSFSYAAPGDTNLDWNVDILDAANFFAGGKYDSGSPATWNEGDFSYDGLVDILDAADFVSTGLFDAGSYNAPPGATASIAAVPEPTALLHWLAMAAVTMVIRHRSSAARSAALRRTARSRAIP
jgi:fibronectin-binding autotransporter adhesin